MPGNSLQIGKTVGAQETITLPAAAREGHVYVCGGTGAGKSKFLEWCIRQDVFNWRDSQCGAIVFDPHGLLCQNIMAWVADCGIERPIIPIELRRNDWIISYNLLRRRKDADPSVVVANFVRALAHVWGEGGTDATPLFARWASVVLLTLYQNGYTIADLGHLVAREDIRRAMAGRVTDENTRHAWDFAQRQPKEFTQQITSTLNRFNRLSGPLVMKATFGQPDVSLDLVDALNAGNIILMDLSTKGGLIDQEDADTFATLLLADLWAAAQVRGKGERETIRPFYVYIDECQQYVTPTLAKNLAQARGFGLHLTLANQQPSQFLDAGPHGQALYNAVLGIARTKIVFRTEHPDDSKVLGQQLFMNTFDTDAVKLKLMATKVIGYKQEVRESHSHGTSEAHGASTGTGTGKFHGQSSGAGTGGSQSFDLRDLSMTPTARAEAWNSATTDSSGESHSSSANQMDSTTASESVTTSIVDKPVLGQEVSSIQFRSIDEQIFRAMQLLFDQDDRHFAVRYPDGPKAPLFIVTPTVDSAGTPKKAEELRQKLLSKLPFAMRMADAVKNLDGRQHKILTDVVNISNVDEPESAARRIKEP